MGSARVVASPISRLLRRQESPGAAVPYLVGILPPLGDGPRRRHTALAMLGPVEGAAPSTSTPCSESRGPHTRGRRGTPEAGLHAADERDETAHDRLVPGHKSWVDDMLGRTDDAHGVHATSNTRDPLTYVRRSGGASLWWAILGLNHSESGGIIVARPALLWR